MALALCLLLSSATLPLSSAVKDEFGWMAAEMRSEGDMLPADGPGADPESDPQPWTCKYPQPDGSCVHSQPTKAQWEFAQKAIPQGKPCKDCPNIVFSLTVSCLAQAPLLVSLPHLLLIRTLWPGRPRCRDRWLGSDEADASAVAEKRGSAHQLAHSHTYL